MIDHVDPSWEMSSIGCCLITGRRIVSDDLFYISESGPKHGGAMLDGWGMSSSGCCLIMGRRIIHEGG